MQILHRGCPRAVHAQRTALPLEVCVPRYLVCGLRISECVAIRRGGFPDGLYSAPQCRIMAHKGTNADGVSDMPEADGVTARPMPTAQDRTAGRPRHCWEIARQIPGLHFNCEECYAYFVQQDCWTLWALRRPGFKPCCQKKGDC